MGLSEADLCDRFAIAVGRRYLEGGYSFAFADGAMNHLFVFMTSHLKTDQPHVAWSVYEAFDEGEYIRVGEAEDQQGEARTRALLARIDAVTNRTV